MPQEEGLISLVTDEFKFFYFFSSPFATFKKNHCQYKYRKLEKETLKHIFPESKEIIIKHWPALSVFDFI